MKINQLISETTTAGSVAPVEHAFVKMQTRNPSVYGDQKVGSLFKGKKTNKKFANSIKEGKQVAEAELQEDDIILIPGQGNKFKPGFHKIDPDKAEHEGETLKNSLHTIIRVATHLNNELSTRDNFPEWVSEKIGAIKSNMVNVMDYLISSQEMTGDTMETVGGSPEANRELTKMSMNRDELSQQAIGTAGSITNGAQGESVMREDVPEYNKSGYWDVYLWGNWYAGKYYDFRPRKVAVPGNSAEEALEWVNSHHNELYDYYRTRKMKAGGRRMLPNPVEKNLFLDRTKAIGPSQSYKVPPQEVAEANPHNFDSDVDYYAAQNAPAKARSHARQSPGVNQDDEAYFREIFRKNRLAKQKQEREQDHERLATGTNEGAKVDRMVKHVAQSEKKLGHSEKEAENIAWATANKRGMLDNKNKKK